ncbi:hypothetical protein TI05_04265 [Achromatium sp. WMS3]|nr:hypothetical protein TI05_04265 [Achromatium sp. WMS3]
MSQTSNVQVQDLLIEIGTEELPPKALHNLATALTDEITSRLNKLDLAYENTQTFATPRRLGVRITNLATAQPAQERMRRGPSLKATFDVTGMPTKAALGFAKSCGVTVGELDQEETAKGTWLVFKQQITGQPATKLIPTILTEALGALPIPKRMRWGESNAEFVRPVHWIVLLFGNKVIKAEILSIQSHNKTYGHRFHHPQPITINKPGDYTNLLRTRCMVEPDFAIRRAKIQELVQQTATTIGDGVTAVIQDGLLDEVTALCEWPVPVMGSFDPEFLKVPTEALIETMQGHQKYFPILDAAGKLLPKFITISNIESKDPTQVRIGNERVIRPRFQDAAFFWHQDRKQPLEKHLEALKKILYQKQLGSMWDKTQRLVKTSTWIASQIDLNPELAQRSALLCKCDLLSNMVGEFANLQGIIGRYLAQADQEAPEVATAIEEHYWPRHAKSSLPQTKCGQAIALADRLDNLVGIFALGIRPTGLKDPYGLRRAAVGILRILIETPLSLDLHSLVNQAAATFPVAINAAKIIEDVIDYLLERLPSYYSDQNITPDLVDAVLKTGLTIPAGIDQRIHALLEFQQLPEAESLAAAHKRIRNILRQAAATTELITTIQPTLLQAPEEKALYEKIESLRPTVQDLFNQGQYATGLRHLAHLNDSLNTFFDTVMVMVEDIPIRQNRLALLQSLTTLFGQVAEFSRLQPKAIAE